MNEIYSKVSVLILRLWLCLVETVGCVRPVAFGIHVSAFLACAHRPFTLVFIAHRRELALVVGLVLDPVREIVRICCCLVLICSSSCCNLDPVCGLFFL